MIISRGNLGVVRLLDITPREIGVSFISTYIIDSGGDLGIIESGPTSSAEKIVRSLRDLGLTTRKIHIIPTHIHLDHGGGTGTLLRLLEGSEAYIHPRGVRHIIEPSKLWREARTALGWLAEVYGAPEPGIEGRVHPTDDGSQITIGSYDLKIIHTPGHASHHQSIFLEEESILFVGDSAGIYVDSEGYVVPTTMPIIRFNMYVESLKKQINLNPEVIAYTHYGVSTRGAEILEEHVKQVESWFEAVKEAYQDGISDVGKILEYVLKYEEDAEKLRKVVRLSRAHELLVKLSIEGLRLEVERILGSKT